MLDLALLTAGVAFFQRLFLSLTGAQSDAAIVMTTLVVAGTFTPVRKSWRVSIWKPKRQRVSTIPALFPFMRSANATVPAISA